MAHYAFLDENNIVTDVIVGCDENNIVTDVIVGRAEDGTDWEQHYGAFRGQVCKRTSYNTMGGVHGKGGTPFRKNYAGVGFFYDEVRDAFIPPPPYPSWVLNEVTCQWDAPYPYPDETKMYQWNEDIIGWVLAE
jgi:hypothetical protein